MTDMRRYIVSYDISSDRARRQVVRLLCRRGRRLQESVFELLAQPEQLSRLLRRIEPLIASTDNVLAFAVVGEAQMIGAPRSLLGQARMSVV